MSTSKKKRMGSQRRSLNPNVQESPETSDTAKSPPLPQGRQRADAIVDLTLSPGSTQPDPPARKKKLSSQRGNKGKLHFKETDVVTESSHEPLEEVDGTARHSQAPDSLGIKNASIDGTIEINSTEGNESADESSIAGTSTLTEATSSMPQTSDIPDSDMETRSDLPLNDDQNNKYLPKIASTQEGVLTEMDLAQQMPDILEATLPAGVTGESTYPVRLIEQEDINITGSRDHNNKLNAGEDEAGHIEKPVCQQSDDSSLPTAKIRKLGSSRRRKEVNLNELQDQGHEVAVENNIANALETTDITVVQNTQEVTVDTPPDNAYREENQPKMHASQKVKDTEDSKVEELSVDFKHQEVKETKPNDEEKAVGPQALSELSFVEIPPTDDTIAPQSSPHPDVTVSIQDVEAAKIIETGDSSTQKVFEETNEPTENITAEDSVTSGITGNNVTFHSDFFASELAEKKEPADQEIKDETLISSSLPSEIPSELEREKSSIAEFIMEDETIQLGDPMFGAQMGVQSSTEELLHFDQNDNSDLLNVSGGTEPEDKNEVYVAQTEDVDQVTSSSGSVSDEDKDSSTPTNINTFSDYKSVDLIEQQFVNTSIDVVCTIPDQIYESEDQEEGVKLSDDQSEIVHSDDIIAPLVSPNTSEDNISGEDNDIKTEGFFKTETIATVVQEPTKSNTYPNENVDFGLFALDEGNKEIDEKSFTKETIESSKDLLSKEMCPEESVMLLKDEAVTEATCEQSGIYATEELLHLNENKNINVQNVTAHTKNVTDNSADLELGENTDKLLFSATRGAENESEGAHNVILEQQPEPLITFKLSTDPKEEDKQLVADEQLVYLQNDKTSEFQEPQVQQTDTDAPLTSEVAANTKDATTADSQLIGNRKKLGSSRRIKGRRQVNDEAKTEEKPVESITPVIFTEEIQTEPALEEQDQTNVMVNEDPEVDKDLSKLIYETAEELKKDEIPQQEPSSVAISKEGQSVDNKQKQYAEGNYFALIANDGENQPTELNNSNDNVPAEVSEDQMENNEMIVGLPKEDISYKDSIQIPHTDNINASLASTHPVVSVAEEDVTQLIGSQDNTESKQEKTDITPNERIEITQVESVIEEQRQRLTIDSDILVEQTAEGSIKVQDEALEEQIVEDNASKNENIQSNVTDNVLEVNSSLSPESLKEPQDTEKNEVETEMYALKEPINVHQLTYISDNEGHEEIDTSSLLQAEHLVQGESTGEPSEAAQLVNAPNTEPLHGPRRKLGSSRRMKARKPELSTTNDEPSNESQDIAKVTEYVQSAPTEMLPQKELNIPDFSSEVEAELTNQSNAKPEDTIFSLLEQTVDSEISNQDKDKNSQENKSFDEIQKGLTAAESSFTIIDLNDKAEAGSPHNADILQDYKRGGSEEMITTRTENATQSVVIVAEDKPKDQQEVQDMEVLKTTSESKRRKMGSTRRSQLNKKQQDEEKSPEDNAAMYDITTAINEKESIATANEEDVGIAALSPGKHDQQNEEGAERQMVGQEGKKEEALQTEEAALIEGINKDATMQNLQPITNEEIQPSSPGKRRKMGSTRKNLSSKKESPPEESVTPINMEKEAVVSISSENTESKEHSGLPIHAASLHQQPPDEESPLSQQDNQEKLRPESELEVSSHPDVMTEDTAVARRRKMGSHRKPHTDQSIRQVKDSEESPVHPLQERRAELPKLGQIEANERDNKTFSTASAFNIKGDSRPVGQKIPQVSQPSMNVRRAQQSNIRLAAGYDLSVSKYEVVMIGDSSVGKTSFMQRAQSGKFSPDVPASIGMDSYKWTVVVDGKTVVLHLWDTAGQERFHSMTKQIFHRAQAFLLMYDITCAQTFTAVSYWASCIKEGAGENAVILLLGNKSDSKERKVRTVEGELLAQENDFAFLECSAATGENVIEALETVARLLSQKAARREEPLVLRKPEPRNKGCC